MNAFAMDIYLYSYGQAAVSDSFTRDKYARKLRDDMRKLIDACDNIKARQQWINTEGIFCKDMM